LQKELTQLTANVNSAVVKLIVTRGSGGRGYRSLPNAMPTRILSLNELPAPYAPDGVGISVRWCTTRLGLNPHLAGLKHLNRLEQVLAQNEWQSGVHAEALMRDIDDNVICATAANLFAVIDATICTPRLDRCGISGIMRARVIEAAQALMLTTSERPLATSELPKASEVFITNAVRGIVPVTVLENHRWPVGPLTRQLARALELW
jgi:4-amino-4-deoxychorismate lyase